MSLTASKEFPRTNYRVDTRQRGHERRGDDLEAGAGRAAEGGVWHRVGVARRERDDRGPPNRQ